MDYNHITQFFDKFKRMLSEGEMGRSVIVSTISKNTSIQIQSESIKVKGSVIYISGSPMLRNEVLMRKEKILKELLEAIPHKRFTDIR